MLVLDESRASILWSLELAQRTVSDTYESTLLELLSPASLGVEFHRSR